MLPSFLFIGFQKCGTTTMYDILRQHKDIVLAQDVKEPMYYRVKGLRAIGGRKWYEKRYYGRIAPDDPRMRGEVNAGLAFTNCADKIGRDFPPDTKLVFMMRNPVDRCYSSYKYFLALGFLPYSAVKYDLEHGHAEGFHHYVRSVLCNKKERHAIMKKRLKYLAFCQGNYATCINEYMRYFPKENMKFIFFEDFIRDEEGVCRDLYQFLGIEDDPDIQYHIKSNEGVFRPSSPISPKVGLGFTIADFIAYEFLDLHHKAPALYNAFDKINQPVQERCVVQENDFSPMLPKTRKLLEKYYRRQKDSVAKLTGHDLDELWFK